MKQRRCITGDGKIIDSPGNLCDEHIAFYKHKFKVRSETELYAVREFVRLLDAYKKQRKAEARK